MAAPLLRALIPACALLLLAPLATAWTVPLTEEPAKEGIFYTYETGDVANWSLSWKSEGGGGGLYFFIIRPEPQTSTRLNTSFFSGSGAPEEQVFGSAINGRAANKPARGDTSMDVIDGRGIMAMVRHDHRRLGTHVNASDPMSPVVYPPYEWSLRAGECRIYPFNHRFPAPYVLVEGNGTGVAFTIYNRALEEARAFTDAFSVEFNARTQGGVYVQVCIPNDAAEPRSYRLATRYGNESFGAELIPGPQPPPLPREAGSPSLHVGLAAVVVAGILLARSRRG